MIVTEREAETQAEGEAGSMPWSPKWDSIPGLQVRTLGQRQVPNHCTTQGSPFFNFSRTIHTVFHSGYVFLHAHQECKGATPSP